MVATLIGMIGLAFAANGVLMLGSIESAMQQTVVALYIIGGVVVLALAIVIATLQDIREKATPAVRAAPTPDA